MGGTIKNSSSRIYETLQATTRKVKHNGKSVHKTFTNRQNLQQSVAHMAMGEEWDAVEVKDGLVVGLRRVRAGDALIKLLSSVPQYQRWAPLISGVAGVKGASPLAVSCVEWERALRLTERVVEPRVVLRSPNRARLWRLPARTWQDESDRLLSLQRKARSCFYIPKDGDKRIVLLPSASELTLTLTPPAHGASARRPPRVNDLVLVSNDMDVMTDVEV